MDETKKPRHETVLREIARLSADREGLLNTLEAITQGITQKRTEKATELSKSLDGQIQLVLTPSADQTEYRDLLDRLYGKVSSREYQIKNRDLQLSTIAASIAPMDLSRALLAGGVLTTAEGKKISICDFCGVTENTKNVLCRIASNIHALNKLQVVSVPDVPTIRVRRRGETRYADLRTGLSPGEQSAAILTLALETRKMPLVLDQPEDELGYAYVVHLIVPKTLRAKFCRQLLVVTHNANIPVLGDADFIIKMENRPHPEKERECVVAEAGCFESAAVTRALLDLDGGRQAFEFRRHRYSLSDPASGRNRSVAAGDG